MNYPRFISKSFHGFKVTDIKDFLSKKIVQIYLTRQDDKNFKCSRCGEELQGHHSSHQLRLKHLDLFQFKTTIFLLRRKGHCSFCKKIRSEAIDFLSVESPHLTKEYAWWLGTMCEITAVSRVAEFTGNNKSTMLRLDFNRLKRMFQNYKIPDVDSITVDEVYARAKKYHARESRDKRFFTIICDLKTRRVIYVTESRDKAALDEFFNVIGKERSQKIKVVAMDQHAPFAASVEENCPQADIVWDRFHIMQSFEKTLNEERKEIHYNSNRGSDLAYYASGSFKYLFLKKAKDRNKKEVEHIKMVAKKNHKFYYMELIKERMMSFFYERTYEDAWGIMEEIGVWIKQAGLKILEGWYKWFVAHWKIIKNYFKHRVTSALSEGQNNVIKSLKRRGFGYRNMAYFKLKILQVCGFLNSRYVSTEF